MVRSHQTPQDSSCRTMTKLDKQKYQYPDARGKVRGFICAKLHAIWQLLFHFGHHSSICQTSNHSSTLRLIKSAASPVTLHVNIFLPYSLKIWNLLHCQAVVSPTSLLFCWCVCVRVLNYRSRVSCVGVRLPAAGHHRDSPALLQIPGSYLSTQNM